MGGMTGGMGGFTPGGMMSGTWGPTAPATQPTVTADQAKQIAQQWLDQYQAGSATEAPDSFPGYYTVHIMKDGTTKCFPERIAGQAAGVSTS
jgi:hypothetical protein